MRACSAWRKARLVRESCQEYFEGSIAESVGRIALEGCRGYVPATRRQNQEPEQKKPKTFPMKEKQRGPARFRWLVLKGPVLRGPEGFGPRILDRVHHDKEA
jgi:hypothetical protein